MILLQPANAQSIDVECTLPPERQFIDAIFNHDIDRARQVLKKFDNQHYLIPSFAFYNALNDWVEGTINNDAKQIKGALRALAGAVADLKSAYEKQESPESLLAWNLAAANTARMLLDNDQIFAAYHLGNPAIKKLQLYLQGETTRDGRAAALLALGLHHVYSNAIPDKYKWVGFLLNSSGTFEQGRELIEQSLQHSRQLAPEAARALLLEVPWSNQQICDYLGISQELSQAYPRNPDFSIVYQGVLVRCGQPADALAENRRFVSTRDIKTVQGMAHDNYEELFQMGRIRGFVELGNLEAIIKENPVTEYLEWFKVLALANTLDILGNKEDADLHYLSIVETQSAPKSLRESAKMWIEFPYTRIKKRNEMHAISMAGCKLVNGQ